MTDETTPNRATVALVDAKIDGLHALVKAGFAGTQRQLDDLTGLPVRVAVLEADLKALREREDQRDEDVALRLSAVEARRSALRTWRWNSLPMILLTLALVVVSAIAIFH